jgi:hypothetical protein
MSCCGRSATIKIDRPVNKPLVPIKPKPLQRLKITVNGQSFNDRERHRG